MKEKGGTIKVLAMWLGIIGLVYLVVATGAEPATAQGCPHKIEGNQSAEIKIQYFGQKYCSYCWMEEPLLEELVEQHGDKFSLEYYDVRSCAEGVRKFAVQGTPTLVFTHNAIEHVARGFLDALALRQKLCEIGGIC